MMTFWFGVKIRPNAMNVFGRFCEDFEKPDYVYGAKNVSFPSESSSTSDTPSAGKESGQAKTNSTLSRMHHNRPM